MRPPADNSTIKRMPIFCSAAQIAQVAGLGGLIRRDKKPPAAGWAPVLTKARQLLDAVADAAHGRKKFCKQAERAVQLFGPCGKYMTPLPACPTFAAKPESGKKRPARAACKAGEWLCALLAAEAPRAGQA